MFIKKIDKYLIITLMILLLYCLYFLVQGKLLLKGNSDMIDLNIPYFMAVNDAVKTDLVPLWTRFTFTGFPLIGSQTLLWYPPNWIAFIVPKSYVPHAMTVLAWLYFIGVAWAAFIYFREISKSSYWASVSAIAYTFSLPVMYGLTCMVSYLPNYMFTLLALYIIHTAVKRPWKLNVIYIALTTFSIITGGFIQTAFYSIPLIFLYSIFIRVFGAEPSAKDKRVILYCLGGIILGVILSAPMLLPFLAMGIDTSRDYLGLSPSSIYTMFKTSPILLWRLFSPNAFGFNMLFTSPTNVVGGVYVESMNAFCGIIPLFLAGYAITVRRSPLVIFWLSIFIGIILIAMSPLAYLHIIGFGFKPILYNRITFLLPLTITAMAAISGQYIDSQKEISMKKVLLNPFWILLLIAVSYGIPSGHYMRVEIVRGVIFIGVLLLCSLYLCKKNKSVWRLIIFCLILFEVIWSGHLMTKVQVYPLMVKPKDYYTYGNPINPFPLSKHDLEQYRVVLSKIEDKGGVAPFGAKEANQGIVYGYMSPWGYNNAFSSRLSFLLKKLSGEYSGGYISDRIVSFYKGKPPFDRLADLTSVGYVINFHDGQWHIVEDRRVTSLPRASLFYEQEFETFQSYSKRTPREISGLVGYWKFDGSAEDSSGNNNHGKWIGEECYSEDGMFGKAAYFDGASNYITVPHSASIDVGKGAFSFGAWVNCVGKKNDTNQYVLNKHTGGHGVYWNMYLSAKVENINTEVAAGSLGNPQSNMKLHAWHHIMFTRDRFGVANVYIDGWSVKSEGMSGDSTNTHAFNIGNLVASLDQGFNGLIDEVVIYNRSLTKKEVRMLSAAHKNKKELAVAKLEEHDFPLKHKVILTSKFNIPLGPPDPNSSVKFIKNGNSHIILEVGTKTPAILLLTDIFADGWSSRIDGRQADIMEGNIAFQAVYIPSGKHEVEFKYFPPGLMLSLLLSLVGISILCCIKKY